MRAGEGGGTGVDDELAEVLLPRKEEEGQRLVGVAIEGPACAATADGGSASGVNR